MVCMLAAQKGLNAQPFLQQLNRPLFLRAAFVFAVRKVYVRIRCGRRRGRVSDTQRRHAVHELMRLAPAPEPRLLGGERIDTHTYCRFLSVNNWDPVKASAMIKQDFTWRMRYQPRMLRPSDMPTMCRQRAWMVLTKPVRTPLWGVGVADSGGASGGNATARFHQWRQRRWLRFGAEQPPRLLPRWSLHPPHTRPPLTQWRCTRQGMPFTLCIVSEWHPERCSHDERIKHVAYHMEHYIRRMPTKHGGTRRVHRCCFLMDMRGFKPSMVRAARPFDPFSTSRDLTHTRILTRGSLTDTAASPHQVGH